MKKISCLILGRYKNLKNPKISYTFEKNISSFHYCCKCKNEDQKIFKKEESFSDIKNSWFN